MKRVSTLIVYIAMLAMTSISVLYANWAVHDNNAKFCTVITTVNDAYKDSDPQTELGRELKRGYAKLAEDLDC